MTLLSASIPRGVSFARVVRLALVCAAAAGLVMNESADAARRRRVARPATPVDQMTADFAWFAGLDYPDVKGSQPALVATASWEGHYDDPPKNTYRYGFVLKSDAAKFTVFFPNLTTVTFERTPAGTPEHLRRDFQPVDPAKLAEGYRALFGDIDDEQSDRIHREYRRRVTTSAEAFVAAWCCSRLGNATTAAELYGLSRDKTRNDVHPDDSARSYSDRVREELAQGAVWHAYDLLEDPSAPRSEAADAFARFVKNFSDSRHAKLAGERAEILTRMVREDRDHVQRRKSGPPFEQLSRDEQVAELLFRLRDQGGVNGPMGDCDDILGEVDGRKDSSAHQLVAIGYDAVPQLIAALDDPRLSRAVTLGRALSFSEHVLTVGDCAYRIICEIAGRRFDKWPANPLEETDRQRIEAWYAEVRRKGEKQYLLDAVAIGDEAGASLAQQLLTKYPQDALPALLAGAKRASDVWERKQLVDAIGAVPGDDPVPFLLEELRTGSACMSAAQSLHRRGRPEGVAAMIATLKDPRCLNGRKLTYSTRGPSPPPPLSVELAQHGNPEQELFNDALIDFLARSGRPEAIDALGERLDRRPVRFRFAVAEVFSRQHELGEVENEARSEAIRPMPFGPRASLELRHAALRSLLTLLDDVELRYGPEGSWVEGIPNPRVCDAAAETLHDVDPARYSFDPKASFDERDRSRLVIRNGVRKELGLAPIVLPND